MVSDTVFSILGQSTVNLYQDNSPVTFNTDLKDL
jgi:hypothetical protein